MDGIENEPYPPRRNSSGRPSASPTPSEVTRPSTMSWSPARITSSMVQSTQAAAPCNLGLPVSVIDQSDALNRLSSLRAKARQTSCCPAVRMFAQNDPASLILGQLEDRTSGMKATSGGSSDTEENVPTTMPTGLPSGWVAVI